MPAHKTASQNSYVSPIHIRNKAEVKRVLKATDVEFRYRATARTEHSFHLGPISFELEEGESIAVVGTSGCGKSTLLKLLSGSLRTTVGNIEYGGINLAKLNDSTAAKLRRTSLGVIHQDYSVLPFLTVKENATLPSRLSRRSTSETSHVLHEFGIEHLQDRLVSSLSGGQQQRVAIARAVCQGAEILLCDEPTGALDAITAENVSNALYRSLDLGVRGLIISTHDLLLASHAKYVLVMSQGRIKQVLSDASPESIHMALRHEYSDSPQESSADHTGAR